MGTHPIFESDFDCLTEMSENKENKDKKGKEWKFDDFKIGKSIGKGRFGSVYVAKEKKSSYVVALKILFKKQIRDEDLQHQVRREVEIQSHLKHKNICRLYGYFHDDKRLFIILEYCKNGTLWKKLKEAQKFSLAVGGQYIAQIASALEYIHSVNVIHRDLKPENVLLGSNDEAKLADFGWCVHTPQSRRNTFCGTLDYLSPEMLDGRPHDKKIDHWSLGCMAFELIHGSPPFEAQRQDVTQTKIKAVEFSYPDSFPQEPRPIIDGLLKRDASSRMDMIDVIQSDWLKPFKLP